MREVQRLNQNSLIIYFAEDIDSQLLPIIAAFRQQLLDLHGDLVLDTVSAYISLLIVFFFFLFSYSRFKSIVDDLLLVVGEGQGFSQANNFEIPVLYSSDVAPDLLPLSKQKNLSVEELVNMHCEKSYTVYAVGFSPGFAYLGEVDQRIAMPRLTCPRTEVPAGSVGIAEAQTGVYPTKLPGGWNIIGRTPPVMFDPQIVFPIQIGDKVTFRPVSVARFSQLEGKSLQDYQGES